LPEIISFVIKWQNDGKVLKKKQLLETGLNYEIIDKAVANFVEEILYEREINSTILCAKDPQFIENVIKNLLKLITVTLSNFRRTRTVPFPNRAVPNSNFLLKIQLGTFDAPYYRTIITNLELFLKTRIFLKNTIK
jgi:hypothetical protein